MRFALKFLAFLGLVGLCAGFAAAAQPTVGDMGSVDRIDLAGSRFAPPERLKEALGRDLQFLLAAEPSAALDGLLTTIRDRLEAGYRRAGFAEVAVDVRPNLQTRRIVAVVNEGPRYVAGNVQIVGESPVSARELAAWLSRPHPVVRDDARVAWQPAEDVIVVDDVGKKPIWISGQPARFNRWSGELLRRQVYLAFAEAGYFFPKLHVDVLPVGRRGQADLVVEIEELGPPGVIGSIEVVGAQRHPPEAIGRYLELAPGQPINRARLAAIQTRLYESARFVFFAAIPQPPKEPGDSPRLVLKLIETADGALLGERLSPEEESLLRLRGWLTEQIRSGQEDLVLSLRDASLGVRTLQTVVSARGLFVRADVSDPSRALGRGVLFRLRSLTGVKEPKDDTLHCLAGVDLTSQQIALYSPMRDRFYATTPGERQLSLRLKLQPDPRQQRKLALSLDPQVTRAEPKASVQPVVVDVDLAPAAFVMLAHVPEAHARVEQGVLRIKTSNALLEADAATGRLLQASLHDAKHEHEATLSASANRLETSVAEMRRISSGDRNDYDARRPMTSLTAFGVCELAHLWRAWEGVALVGDKQGFDVWQGLLAAYFLPDADSGPVFSDEGDTYFIPAEPLSANRPVRDENAVWLAAEALRVCREVFPAESWPCRLARTSLLHYAGDDKAAQRELSRIDSATTGPLGHLAAALLAGMIEPTLVKRFAAGGLERLNLTDFRRDYSLVLESRSPVVESALSGLGQLGRLDSAHSQAALSVLPKPLASFLGDLVERERTLANAPTEVVLAGLLDDYWSSGLELQVRFVLRWLAESAPPAATARGKSKTKAR
jgi:hypothetical protein